MKKIYIFGIVIAVLLLASCGCLFYQHTVDEKRIEESQNQLAALQTQYDTLLSGYDTIKFAYDDQTALVAELQASIEEYSHPADIEPIEENDEEDETDINSSEATSSQEATVPEQTETSTPAVTPVSTPAVTYTYSPGQNVSYLAIGNSITRHGENEYWWNEIGMAATSSDKDFVHLVRAGIESITGYATLSVTNFVAWELNTYDRVETYCLIDSYLDAQPDIISLQLSENVTDMSHFQSDFEELIRYIQGKCPNAQIIVIDDFWYGGDKSNLKKRAAENTGVQFVSLASIRNNANYQCGMGSTVYDAQGNPHTVEHEGVAMHPNDAGMQYIADGVLQYIN